MKAQPRTLLSKACNTAGPIRTTLAALFASLALAACAMGGGAGALSSGQAAETWHNFAQGSAAHAAPQGMAGLVFFRPVAGQQQRAISVSLGGIYHASLLPGGYRASLLCPTEIAAAAIPAHLADPAVSQKRDSTQLRLLPGQTLFVRTDTDPQGHAHLSAATASEAAALMRGIQLQANTISRVTPAALCPHTPAQKLEIQ